jgi:hypothetical protein
MREWLGLFRRESGLRHAPQSIRGDKQRHWLIDVWEAVYGPGGRVVAKRRSACGTAWRSRVRRAGAASRGLPVPELSFVAQTRREGWCLEVRA